MAKIDKEMIMEVLKDMRLRPKYDEDGTLIVKYQMRTMVILPADDETGFVQVVMPNVYCLDDDQEQMCGLYVCNKLTRDSRHVKVWLDDDMTAMNASSEFYAEDKDSLQNALNHGLRLLSTICYVAKKQMVDYMSDSSSNDEGDVDDDSEKDYDIIEN